MIVLVIGVGIFLSIATKFTIYRRFGFILKNTFGKIFDKRKADDAGITPFQAVTTALASTVGTGNIAGVATALSYGGPGAVFWMWMAALLGLTTKFAEVTLAVAYREKNEKGEYVGGPMYYLKNGLGLGWLGKLFALFAAIASFGIGSMVQSQSVASALKNQYQVPQWITGLVVSLLAAVILIGGIKRIGQVTEKLVPLMALFYIVGGIVILVINYKALPEAFRMIFAEAFTGTAAIGGFAGAGVAQAIRYGVARGLFSNEAGLGSAPIAHASATTDHPVRQGIWGSFEVFIDTVLVCTITALVIITTGLWSHPEYEGSIITIKAFESVFKLGGMIVTVGLVLFPFTTIIGWCYYGEKSAEYLFNSQKVIKPYRVLFILLAFLGSIGKVDLVWNFADIMNALMAVPNIIGVFLLSGVIVRLTKQFFEDPEKEYSPEDYQHLLYKDHAVNNLIGETNEI